MLEKGFFHGKQLNLHSSRGGGLFLHAQGEVDFFSHVQSGLYCLFFWVTDKILPQTPANIKRCSLTNSGGGGVKCIVMVKLFSLPLLEFAEHFHGPSHLYLYKYYKTEFKFENYFVQLNTQSSKIPVHCKFKTE